MVTAGRYGFTVRIPSGDVQIVGYETAVEGPAALRVAGEEGLVREPLEAGRELGYALGERHCAGTVDGEHVPCDQPGAPYCPEHTTRWPCARCRGNCDRPTEACREEHAVYLAAFAPGRFKVGVTRSWRLRRRLREQGADRGAHLHTVSDGRIARRIEADIAEAVGDSVRVERKIEGLHRSVDTDAWADLLAGFDVIESFAFDYGLELDRQPVPATLAAGTVRGTKGRLLVVRREGTTYAVDMRALVGYEIGSGPVADRQSSLSAFE